MYQSINQSTRQSVNQMSKLIKVRDFLGQVGWPCCGRLVGSWRALRHLSPERPRPFADPGPSAPGLCCQTRPEASHGGSSSFHPGARRAVHPSAQLPSVPHGLHFAGGHFQPGTTAWWPLSHRASRTCLRVPALSRRSPLTRPCLTRGGQHLALACLSSKAPQQPRRGTSVWKHFPLPGTGSVDAPRRLPASVPTWPHADALPAWTFLSDPGRVRRGRGGKSEAGTDLVPFIRWAQAAQRGGYGFSYVGFKVRLFPQN